MVSVDEPRPPAPHKALLVRGGGRGLLRARAGERRRRRGSLPSAPRWAQRRVGATPRALLLGDSSTLLGAVHDDWALPGRPPEHCLQPGRTTLLLLDREPAES